MTFKKFLLLILIVPLVFLMQSCGKGSGSGYTPPGKGPGQPTYIKLLPSRFVAQTNGCINLFAEVHDETGERLANVAVTFTNLSEPFGQLLDTCGGTEINPPVIINTDRYGRAKVTIFSTTPGFATILAQLYTGIGHVRDMKTVFFSQFSLALLPSMILDVDGDSNGIFNETSDFILFEATGDNEVLVRATVFDIYGLPEPFSVVTFGSDFPYRVGSDPSCSDGTNECEVVFPLGNTATTDINGQASVIVRVDPITIRTISALMNITATADNGAANLVTLFLEPVIISNVVVSADPDVVNTDGNSTLTIGATLNTGHPAPDGTSVSLTTCDAATCTSPCGSVDPFVQTTEGGATATFNAPSIPNICRVNATANGVSGFTDITVTNDLAVVPDSVDVNGTVGGTVTFTVLNGIAPYTVLSDTINPNLQPNPATVMNDGDTFTVTVPAGTPDTSVTYTVIDTASTQATATLDITANALTVLPDSVSIDGTADGVATFTVFGGAPGYTIISNDPSLPPDTAMVANSGDTFTVTVPAGTEAKSVTYTVLDTAGDTVEATVDIMVGNLIIIPGSVSAAAGTGGPFDFTVAGGLPPYIITSSDSAAVFDTAPGDGQWDVAASGDQFTANVSAIVCPTTVTLDVYDSAANTTSATVDITAGALVLTPSGATICEDNDGCVVGLLETQQFTISGGLPPYTTLSSDAGVIPHPGAGTPFVVDAIDTSIAADTTITLTTTDSCGDSITADVLVINE